MMNDPLPPRPPDALVWTAWNDTQHWAFRIRDEYSAEAFVLACGGQFSPASRDVECHDLVAVTCERCRKLCGPNRRLEYIRAELRAEHLRLALGSLDEITGETGTEAVLDAVFARFCIGK